LEFFKSGDGDTVIDGGTDLVRFLESKLPVERTTGFDIERPLASGGFPSEVDLSIDELVASFSGLGPPDKD
jgi:hypothetical protein